MSSDLVLCDRTDRVWTITLNRSDKANALNIEVLQILKAHFAAAAQEPGLRALILTGTGEQIDNADVVRRDGRIVELGVDLEVAVDVMEVKAPTLWACIMITPEASTVMERLPCTWAAPGGP